MKELVFASLKNRKLRTILTLLGIIIGTAAIVSLISLGQGMRDAIAVQLSGLGGDRIIIQAKSATFAPPGQAAIIKLSKEDYKRVQQTTGVRRAAIRLIKSAKVEANQQTIFPFIGSMPEDTEGRRLVEETFNLRVVLGRLIQQGDTTRILVGNGYNSQDRLGKPLIPGTRLLINDKSFTVVGVLDKLGQPQFDNVMFMPEQAMRDLYNLTNEVDIIAAQAANGWEPNTVAENIRKNLANLHHVKEGSEDFTVQTQGQVLAGIDTILLTVTMVLAGIAVISVIVGGIGIMNTMYTSVLERTREIGILKAVGARRLHIVLLFVAEAGILGCVGGILGVVIGAGLAKTVEVIAGIALGTPLIHANLSISLFGGTILATFLFGIVAGVLPALSASKLQPTEALRYE